MKTKKKAKPISDTIDEKQSEDIKSCCDSLKISRSDYIRSAILLKQNYDINGPELALACCQMIEGMKEIKERIDEQTYTSIARYPEMIMKLMRREED